MRAPETPDRDEADRDEPGRDGAGQEGAAADDACRRPGCHGVLVEGRCTVCGTPSGSVPDAGDDNDALTLSTRLAVAPLGSRAVPPAGSVPTRQLPRSTRRLRSGHLGAGLTHVPPAPTVDAQAAVMAEPIVPEHKRSCPTCGAPVGRSHDGRPGLAEGHCTDCGTRYSFTPKLHPGEVVAGQYLIAGCLAYGGLGWIYLARDRNVSDRWVVLKGLLNSGDPEALAVAIAEQQFLAQVEHPLIVEIFNVVRHRGAGYIVMEYVGGRSLKQLLQQRRRDNDGRYDPLPPDQALAYVLEILPAFAYLHDMGLLYCDFKPDNMIQILDAVKLIDLGGVRRMEDQATAIYGTVGYQAPEVADLGASIASDVYTIGRTLLALCADVPGYQSRYSESLPPVDQTPLFAEYDSLYRLIMRCCAADPSDRFGSIDELRVQLLGVLREVVGSRTPGTSLTSAGSLLFAAPQVSSDTLAWWQLPALRPDPSDPAHAWLSTLDAEDPRERLAALDHAAEDTPEVAIARASAALELGELSLVRRVVSDLLADDPWEWRAVWLSGLGAVQTEDWHGAQSAFNAVYGQVPGELAPKLALALACEHGGEPDTAERLYQVCASTDAHYVSLGAFGMARIRQDRGDTTGAVAALDLVPPTSRGYPRARELRAECLLESGSDRLSTVKQAYRSIADVQLDPTARDHLMVRILHAALALVEADPSQGGHEADTADDERIGSWPITSAGLRAGLEQTYRALARRATERPVRYDLVDRANRVRTWSWR